MGSTSAMFFCIAVTNKGGNQTKVVGSAGSGEANPAKNTAYKARLADRPLIVYYAWACSRRHKKAGIPFSHDPHREPPKFPCIHRK